MRKFYLFPIIIIIMIMIPCNSFSTEIPDDTIIAEYDGGELTFSDLKFKISKIPPMYQSRYETNEGKSDLLDMMCTEELFYIEAKNNKVDETSDYQNRLHLKMLNLFSGEIKNELSVKIEISEQQKKDFYNQYYTTFYLDRPFEEVESDIEMRLKPELLTEMVNSIIDSVKTGENVVIHYENFPDSDLNLLEINDDNKDLLFLESEKPDLKITLADFQGIFLLLPSRQRDMAKEAETRKNLIDDIAELELLNWYTIQQGLDQKQEIAETVEQIKKNLMLQTTYNHLVVDEINISEDQISAYYNDNIDKFSTIGYRKIQTFVFDDMKKAKENRKKVEQFLKEEDYDQINNLINAETVNPRKDGIINHIYDNGIIPGIGKDELYSDMVWETEPGKTSPTELSEIFKNSRDNYVFFRILEDNLSEPKPFEEVKENVKAKLNKELTNQKFEEVKQELTEEYSMVKYPERTWIILTPEEYFLEAENSQKNRKFHEAIFYYDQIMKYYQNNVDDYKAHFMKAFLYSEELKEIKKAIEEFELFLDKYPESDLHESARFMLQDLRGESDLLDILND